MDEQLTRFYHWLLLKDVLSLTEEQYNVLKSMEVLIGQFLLEDEGRNFINPM